jgi:hypothetical protein
MHLGQRVPDELSLSRAAARKRIARDPAKQSEPSVADVDCEAAVPCSNGGARRDAGGFQSPREFQPASELRSGVAGDPLGNPLVITVLDDPRGRTQAARVRGDRRGREVPVLLQIRRQHRYRHHTST